MVHTRGGRGQTHMWWKGPDTHNEEEVQLQQIPYMPGLLTIGMSVDPCIWPPLPCSVD